MEQLAQNAFSMNLSESAEAVRHPSRPRKTYRARGQVPLKVEQFVSAQNTPRKDPSIQALDAKLRTNNSKSNKRLFTSVIAATCVLGSGVAIYTAGNPDASALASTVTSDTDIGTIAAPEPVVALVPAMISITPEPLNLVSMPATIDTADNLANVATDIAAIDRAVLSVPVTATDVSPASDTPSAPETHGLQISLGVPKTDTLPQVPSDRETAVIVFDRPALTVNEEVPSSFICIGCQPFDPKLQNILLNIYTSPGIEAEQIAGITDIVRSIGVPNTTSFGNETAVNYNQVRFFHQDDAAAAQTLADAVDATVVDFTWTAPLPGIGTIDLMLAGPDLSQ